MILVDTSVWIDHLARPIPHLVYLLNQAPVLTHPLVIAELACGAFPGRTETLAELSDLPRVVRASDDEVISLIERRTLMGRGIGLVDMHLLASTLLTPEARLWTHDERLAQAADDLSIRYEPAIGKEG